MNDKQPFSFDSSGLLTIWSEDGETREVRQVSDMLISTVVPLADRVVLLLTKSKPWGTSKNLVCLDRQANVLWEAPIMETSPYPKEYASVVVEDGGMLSAHTWGGVRVTIDPLSGEVLRAEFVK